MSDVVIDEMTIEDYDGALRLWLETERLGVSPDFDTRERIAGYLRRNPGLSTVARQDGAIVGAVLCGYDGRRGSLCHMAVAREHRLRGIGRRMVERSLGCLSALGITTAGLFVYTSSSDAAAFWSHVGWKKGPDVDYYHREF
jgi:ribosomal protein S18 acetylase RimI-like enzyme